MLHSFLAEPLVHRQFQCSQWKDFSGFSPYMEQNKAEENGAQGCAGCRRFCWAVSPGGGMLFCRAKILWVVMQVQNWRHFSISTWKWCSKKALDSLYYLKPSDCPVIAADGSQTQQIPPGEQSSHGDVLEKRPQSQPVRPTPGDGEQGCCEGASWERCWAPGAGSAP